MANDESQLAGEWRGNSYFELSASQPGTGVYELLWGTGLTCSGEHYDGCETADFLWKWHADGSNSTAILEWIPQNEGARLWLMLNL